MRADPVSLTSVSLVTVFEPVGVVTFVSVFVADFSAQPKKAIENRLKLKAVTIMRFIFTVS